MSDLFGPITREAGLARLRDVAPRMGRAYAAGRNTDTGPGARTAVSRLSPYLSRRVLEEEEVVSEVLSQHSSSAAEKFVQEVFWRSYFKGWLEQRPGVWDAYVAGVRSDLRAVAADPVLADRLARAEAGQTGIACFDAWIGELAATGYLHNHARMWSASIWIFTLGLPWRLGADLFLRQLLDGDAASNTLSWRWVAGLHTRGKNYVARSSNIAQYSDGRFPRTPGLAPDPAPLEGDENPARSPIRVARPPDATRPSVLLITEEDCRPETLLPPGPLARQIGGVLTVQGHRWRSPRGVARTVAEADATALADAAARIGGGARMLDHPDADRLISAVRAMGGQQIVTGYVPVGWTRDWLAAAGPALAGAGITLTEIQRPWDAAVWPIATAGFFKVKKAIPSLLRGAERPVEDLPLFA